MESWMVSLGIAVIASIGTYSVLQYRVKRLESDYKSHVDDSTTFAREIHDRITSTDKASSIRIDAGFKRVDVITDRTTVLERDTANLLDLPTAEAKFITRKELELHLDKIEIITGNTNKEVSILMGKQDEILGLLRVAAK